MATIILINIYHQSDLKKREANPHYELNFFFLKTTFTTLISN